MMKKSELRKLYKRKRKELTKEQVISLQKNIYKQVFFLDFSKVTSIHVFLSIEKQYEIDTQPIIDFLRVLGKTIVISKSDFKTNTLEHYLYNENTRLEVNEYGIPEPVNAESIAVENIDLVFVPMLISDAKNYRVGYGKGFYDRFLKECKSTVKTIGLNFFEPITSIEDVDEHDVALQKVIYPT